LRQIRFPTESLQTGCHCPLKTWAAIILFWRPVSAPLRKPHALRKLKAAGARGHYRDKSAQL